ncbi:MAG: toxin-antitoxin system protein [Lachnospiraceae bacterium]|nr:toxin-antitoxin system protein [Lachnospiraceae bacterium]
MNIIYAEYNIHHNSIYIATAGYLLRIDCWEAEKGLKTTACSECALNILAIDEPLEYARLYFEGNMQMWVDTEDSLELW